MFHRSHAVVLNKIDLLPYTDVRLEELIESVGAVSPEAAVFPVSCRTGEGLGAWIEWLERQIARSRQARADAAVEGH
jgi:hydrogenase nickel incorporation protein HypB